VNRIAKEVVQMVASDLPVFAAFALTFALVLLVLVWSLVAVWRTRQRAERAGYRGIGQYMRAAPRTDAEKKEAVNNLMMRGAARCLLGIVFAPFALLGVVPLYYGGRKITMALLGLDLPADADDVA
jgi:hypothetical protein